MDHHRHQPRRETLQYWPVYDTVSGEALGRVADLTPEGLNIHSRYPVDVDVHFTLRIDLPRAAAGTDHLYVETISLWCRADPASGLCHIGLRLIDPAPDVIACIQRLESYYSTLPERLDGTLPA